jgi:hypothetical protein
VFNDPSSLVASVVIRLEKIEGKRVINREIGDLTPTMKLNGEFSLIFSIL